MAGHNYSNNPAEGPTSNVCSESARAVTISFNEAYVANTGDRKRIPRLRSKNRLQ